ncbi:MULTISPECIES: hypothetical protein [Lonepinella]|uniref:hypothetical protein n=1 Tax=Lonepinella TaxID=53416 RepID=UPI003F6DE310
MTKRIIKANLRMAKNDFMRAYCGYNRDLLYNDIFDVFVILSEKDEPQKIITYDQVFEIFLNYCFDYDLLDWDEFQNNEKLALRWKGIFDEFIENNFSTFDISFDYCPRTR